MARIDPIPQQPWERQPGESETAYAAFCRYRDMPLGDRNAKAAAGQDASAKKVRCWQAWSAKFSWVERAAAWAGYQEKIRLDERIRSIRQAERQNRQAVDIGFGKLIQRLQTIERLELTEGQLFTHLDRFVRLRMAVFGQEPPPEKPKPDRAPLLAELAEVKARAREDGDWNLYFRAMQEERLLTGEGTPMAARAENGDWKADLQAAGMDPDAVFEEAVRLAMAKLEGDLP